MKITKKNDERISFKLNAETKNQIEVLAEEQNCSFSEIVRYAVERLIKKQSKL